MFSRQFNTKSTNCSQSSKNNQNIRKYRLLAPKLPTNFQTQQGVSNFKITRVPNTSTNQATSITNGVETTIITRPTGSLTNPAQYIFNPKLDPQYQNDFDKENLLKFEEMKKPKSGKKRKVFDNKSQINDGWSEEETDKLLNYLEDNFNKYQQRKKSEFYVLVSKDIIKSKTAASIKGRLSRLLEKYDKVKQLNNQTGLKRVDWQWMEKMDRIFGCHESHENVSPSYISNATMGHISDEPKETESEQDSKRVKKNNVEFLIDVMRSINQTKIQISEQKFELEREKMYNDFKLQAQKLEIKKKKWEYKREQSKMLHELTLKKLELQLKQCN